MQALSTIVRTLAGSNARATQLDPDWEGWWQNQIGGRSESGISVTRDNALMLPAVWQAVSMISGDSARLPLDLYRRGGDGEDRQIEREHPAWYPVRWQANSEMTAGQFWRQMLGDALIYNNAYAAVLRSGDMRPRQLLPLLPDRTGPERDADGNLMYTSEVGAQVWTFPPADILHIRGVMLTNADGSAPILLHKAREAIGLALSAQNFQSKFFKNGMRTSGILEIPPGFSKKARDTLEEGFRRTNEGDANWFRTVILRDGAKFHSVAQTNKEGESHQLREDQVREIARLYNLPPSRLGLSDSVSYNSKAEDNQAYYDSTLSPWLAAIQDECWFKLLTTTERQSTELYFEHNTAALLRLDLLKRYQAYEIGVNPNRGGWLLKSEVRKKENMPAIDGIDDTIPTDQPSEAAPLESRPPDEAARAAYGHNLERDEWIAKHWDKYTKKQLSRKLRELADEKGWTPITERALYQALERYQVWLQQANSTAIAN